MDIRAFCSSYDITSTVKPTDRNPHMTGMPPGSTHWKVTLKRGKRRLTIPFSMGPAYRGEPQAAEVLDCLLSDANGYENCGGNFEEWASEYGLDADSRAAEKTFKAVAASTQKLETFLGDLYEIALHQTERL
jgi:hypothetical protein